jgi:hypothetical protein
MMTRRLIPMKIKSCLIPLVAATTLRLAAADILPADTAVFLQPDAKSYVLSRLKAGNTIIYTGDAPAGWRRVELSGTFEAFVHNRDLTKGLEVKPGANILTEPKKDATVLTIAAEGDKTEVVGLAKNSDYCQIKLEKKLQGYIAVGATANLPGGTKPVVSLPTAPTAPSTAVGRAAPTTSSSDTPRLFSGKLVLARRALINPNPPYDFQVVDANGHRFAYVDVRRLPATQKLDTFLEREVVITGTVRNTVDGKDIVIAAESIAYP